MNLHHNPVSNRLRKIRRPEAAADQTSAKKQAKLAFMADEDTDTIMDKLPEVKKKPQTRRIRKKIQQDNAATITLPDSMIPSLDSENIEAQEENDNKNTSTSSRSKTKGYFSH